MMCEKICKCYAGMCKIEGIKVWKRYTEVSNAKHQGNLETNKAKLLACFIKGRKASLEKVL